MPQGTIIKALSGFYTVSTPEGVFTCKARGRFRHAGQSPLVGDRVEVLPEGDGTGRVERVLPRRNWFVRPAVANVDQIVMLASAANPVTDPFLIDRVTAIAAHSGCGAVLCINKVDLDQADRLTEIYTKAGFPVVRTSAETGEGIAALMALLQGKTSAFTGNSGVGKSSVLNRIAPALNIPTGAVSEKLGRGRHTTRHVELFDLGGDTYVADTPGFASLDIELVEPIACDALPEAFCDFRPYLGACRFPDCAHIKEPDCAVLDALRRGDIAPERHESYVRLYDMAKAIPDWERRKREKSL